MHRVIKAFRKACTRFLSVWEGLTDPPMESYSVRYRFSQPFDVSAQTAYEWCTDFRPDDLPRMGEEGTRKIERINEDTLILTDVIKGKRERKQRLVRLNPDRMSWTNTHLNGTNKHSQFWYEVVADGPQSSHLEFTGLQVNYGRPPTVVRIAKKAEELAAIDSGAWLLLAREMRRDLSGPER
jgi:hypothetical protein